MAEDVHRRFLRERKRSVKAEVIKARREHSIIVNYLSEILQQVLLQYFDDHCTLGDNINWSVPIIGIT